MPDNLKVCIAGATGGVGRCLIQALLASDAFTLTGATSRQAAGHDIGTRIDGRACGVTASATLAEALEVRPDVIIAYTHPDLRMHEARCAIAAGIPMVIGTTGFSGAEFEQLDGAARDAGIGLATGNFSLTAALLQHFALSAAQHLAHWTVTDFCKPEKPDVPSGTARELAELMGAVRRPDYALDAADHVGPRAALGADIDGTRVHSVRLPGYTAGVEVRFGRAGERLTLAHEMGGDNSIFVTGSLLAARAVQSRIGLVRGLDKLLFE